MRQPIFLSLGIMELENFKKLETLESYERKLKRLQPCFVFVLSLYNTIKGTESTQHSVLQKCQAMIIEKAESVWSRL